MTFEGVVEGNAVDEQVELALGGRRDALGLFGRQAGHGVEDALGLGGERGNIFTVARTKR